ncbi:hypothetical protein BBP40_001501 [Aspergillus hancockii]|nr:hypothetical protein BBP40_001501 [Aspergillus hancockii]
MGDFAALVLHQILENIGIITELPYWFVGKKQINDKVWEAYQDRYAAMCVYNERCEARSGFPEMEGLRYHGWAIRRNVTCLGLFELINMISGLNLARGFDGIWRKNDMLPSFITYPEYIVRHAMAVNEKQSFLQLNFTNLETGYSHAV